jgi:O-antigen/teichoic acid export membrane protein
MLKTITPFLKDVQKKGFFHLFSANSLGAIIVFVTQLILAYLLLPADIGRIKTLQTLSVVFIIVSVLGFNISTLKICSDIKYKLNKFEYLSNALSLVTFTSIAVYLLLFVLSHYKLLSNDTTVNNLAPIYFLGLVPLSLNQILISFFQSSKEFSKLAKIQVITKFFGMFVIIILSYIIGLAGYAIGYSISFFLSTIFLLIPFLKYIKLNFNSKLIVHHWKFAKFTVLANIVNQVNLNLDILIINYMLLDLDLYGQYALALNFVLILRLIPMSIQQISIPYFSEKSDNLKEWRRVFNKYNKILILISTIGVFLAGIFVPLFIRIMFAGKYDMAIPFFLILIVGWYFRSLYYLKSGALIGLGKIRDNFLSGLISLPITAIILFFMIKNFSIYGAAIGNSVSGIITFIIVSIIFRKATKNLNF